MSQHNDGLGGTMFDPAGPYRARATDPDTAHERAARENKKYGATWKAIEDDVRAHGPSTYREVAERTGIVGTSTSTAMSAMEKAGILKRTGERRNGSMLRGLC